MIFLHRSRGSKNRCGTVENGRYAVLELLGAFGAGNAMRIWVRRGRRGMHGLNITLENCRRG
jgi:hypothetical protein